MAKVLPWVRPCLEPSAKLLKAYRLALDSGRLSNNGPNLLRFEREAASWLGVDEAVAVSSGASALLLSVEALGLSGKVILPAFTYIATLAAFTHHRLEPIFCDIDADAWTLDPESLEVLTKKHRIAAIAAVNVFGVPPDLSAIARSAKKAGAILIYDNAHGFGTEAGGRRAPAQPDVQILSLHATKVMAAIEGGLVLSPNKNLLKEIRRLRNHGIGEDPRLLSPGYNAKMDELRAATGRHSLRRLDAALRRRRAYARRLRSFISSRCQRSFRTQLVAKHVRSNFQNLGVRFLPPRSAVLEEVIDRFRRLGVECRRYFYPPLHHLGPYRGRFSLPNTEALCETLLCLPIHNRMSHQDLARIENALLEVDRSF